MSSPIPVPKWMVNSPAPDTLYSRPWSLTIYMNKPVGPRFGQMVRKIQDWLISSRNRVYHLQFHFPKNDREGVKMAVSKMTLKKWNTNFRLEH